jgi:hypothetical protein
MSHIEARVFSWCQNEAVQVCDIDELDCVIDKITESECTEYPTVIEVEANGSVFSMAVGLPESFVQITRDASLPSYLVAIADKDAQETDTFNFYFQGFHHTEIRRRNILASSKALRVVSRVCNYRHHPQGHRMGGSVAMTRNKRLERTCR